MDNRFVVDTSVVIERAVCPMVEKGEISGVLIVPRAVFAELEHQANQGQEIGLLGLEELQRLQVLAADGQIEVKILGDRPTGIEIKYAKTGGEIDAVIARIAYDEDATLVTADKVQSASAKAAGVKVRFVSLRPADSSLIIDEFFDDVTMSVHLKDKCIPVGKRGGPGNWSLVEVGKKNMTLVDLENMAKEVEEKARMDPDAFIEIARPGSTVVTRPPVSDGFEITAVRPIKQLNLDDYALPEQILSRLKREARGVLIAGETGSGKSTFAQALAEYYASHGQVTKTVESPRDLMLSDHITQYSKNFTDSEEIHDILFLVRPDYLIFDEVRDTPDFKLFSDLRLGGSNVLGVMHSAKGIDAINRFISRLDVGVIPSVVDTILFMKAGAINEVLTLEMVVKVPSGMTEADLARPVIVVSDVKSGDAKYEIYSYGEQTVVIPVTESEGESPALKLAARQLEQDLLNYVSDAQVKMVSANKAELYIPAREIGGFIGKGGENISKMEKMFGLSLDVHELSVRKKGKMKALRYNVRETGKYISLVLDKRHSGASVDVFVDNHFLFSSVLTKKSELKVHKKGKLGQALVRDFDSGRNVEVREA